MINKYFSYLTAALLAGVLPLPASSQPSGALERRYNDQLLRQEVKEAERNQRSLGEDTILEGIKQEDTLPAPAETQNGVSSIKSIVVSKTSALTKAELKQILSSYIGKPNNEATRKEIATRIEELLSSKKILAVVTTVKKEPASVEAFITEGRLDRIIVKSNTSRVSSYWAKKVVSNMLQANSVIRIDKLESALIKLNDLAGVRALGSLKPAEKTGHSNIILELSTTKNNTTLLDLNNTLSQYTGKLQLEGVSSSASWLGRGDSWKLSYGIGGDESGYGARRIAGIYDIPLTPDGLKVTGSFGWSDYRLLQEFLSDHLVGTTRSVNIGLKQPLWRRPKKSLFGQLTYDQYKGQDFVMDTEYSDRTNHATRLTLASTTQDTLLGTGLNSIFAIGSFGYLDKSSNPFEQAADRALANTAGSWGKVQLVASRVQTFKKSLYSLEVFLQAQKAFNNLGAEEKFSIGWPNGVRAYPPGESSADSGTSIQLTLRRPLTDQVTAKLFIDGAYVWRWTNLFSTSMEPNSFGLWGPGIGIDYGEYGKKQLSLNLAIPIGNNPNLVNGLDADGTNASIRMWLNGRIWL